MRQVSKAAILWLIGGAVYVMIELIWRGYSHWTMFLMGGILFLIIGGINEYIPWEIPLILQGIIGSATITAAELCAGLILNVLLGLGIWDYSNLPLNLWGQICLPFSLLWIIISIVAVVLDDWLRYWLFGEEKPHYHVR